MYIDTGCSENIAILEDKVQIIFLTLQLGNIFQTPCMYIGKKDTLFCMLLCGRLMYWSMLLQLLLSSSFFCSLQEKIKALKMYLKKVDYK